MLAAAGPARLRELEIEGGEAASGPALALVGASCAALRTFRLTAGPGLTPRAGLGAGVSAVTGGCSALTLLRLGNVRLDDSALAAIAARGVALEDFEVSTRPVFTAVASCWYSAAAAAAAAVAAAATAT